MKSVDKTSYINLDTYEIVDYPPNFIHADKDIAKIILELNKKGYKTIASCAGHNEPGNGYSYETSLIFYEDWEKNDKPKGRSLAIKKKDKLKIVNLYENTFIYVVIEGLIDFPEISNGFVITKIEDQAGKTTEIKKSIKFYGDNDELKDYEEIEQDLTDSRNYLLEWVNNLENNNI